MLPPSRSLRSGRVSLLASLVALGLLPVLGCNHVSEGTEGPSASAASTAPAPTATAKVEAPVEKRVFAPSRAGCEAVPVFVAGAAAGSVCVDDAAANGLTVLDLSDTWTPRVFSPDAKGDAPDYRAKYLELANAGSADLGLNGIAPSVSVVADRLTDEKRQACDKTVDLKTLVELDEALSSAPDDTSRSAVLKKAQTKEALKSAQSELACAGLFHHGSESGVMTGATQIGLEAFRRRHMIVGGGLDADTLHALSLGGEELDFRGVLRVLRERVADAAGLIEDGSALEQKELVVGRDLDLSRFELPSRGALPHAAPDLVDGATDSAAKELGWTTPAATRTFLSGLGKTGLHSYRVAVTLPAAPAYHSATMDLHVEVDRGDVFYDAPGQAALAKRKLTDFHRPSFVVYAKDGDHDVALMRWATTIGGWKKERTEDGEIALKYKESDVGDRVWRQVVAAPAWLPPDSTPETDLVYEGKDGSVSLKRDLIQPGFTNAYGLVMLIHEEAVVHGGKTTWLDRGIRTHGSVDYHSIQRGESHGCHRLYNQLALRLSGFLLEHRANVRRGKMASGYHRELTVDDQTVDFDVPNRGYLYELDPPVPVRVLEGHIAGDAQKPVSLIHLADDPKKSS
jgi:hypothetical protein